MSAYTICKELLPPQTVEHVEKAHFTSPHKVNIIVARGTLLEVYDFVEHVVEQEPTELADEGNDDNDQEATLKERFDQDIEQALVYPKLQPIPSDTLAKTRSGRLELVSQYKLSGTITSMGAMSLLEWSPATHSVITVSIHYYERDEFKKEFLFNAYPPEVHIDPQQRCAVLNFYSDKIAILPFRQSDGPSDNRKPSKEGGRHLEDDASRWPYSSSFVLDVSEIDSRIRNVIDMVFLHDYYEPTLAILYQSNPTWTGRLAESKDTVSLAVISLDISSRVYPIIYSLDNLPFDSTKLYAMPKPAAGLMVVSANALIYVAQGSPGIGIAVNAYTKTVTSFPGIICNPKIMALGLELEGSKCVHLGGTRLCLFLRDGQWLTVKLIMDGSKVVDFDLERVEEQVDQKSKSSSITTIPSCTTVVKPGYFFLGSRAADSLLIKWTWKDQQSLRAQRNGRPKMPSRASTGDILDLYGPSLDETKEDASEKQVNGLAKSNFQFDICDRLLNCGPIADMTIGELVQAEDESGRARLDNDDNIEIVACCGHGKNGNACVIQRHIHSATSYSFDQEDCQEIWSIRCRKEQYFEGLELEGSQVTRHSRTNKQSAIGEQTPYDKFLVISKSKSTTVISTGEDLHELGHSGFYTKGPTIAAGSLLNETRIIQVHQSGILVLNADAKKKQTISLERSKRVLSACISSPYVVVLLTNKTILAYEADAKSKELRAINLPQGIQNDAITACSIFADESQTFIRTKDLEAIVQARKGSKKKRKNGMDDNAPNKKSQRSTSPGVEDMDAVDMDLYGGAEDGAAEDSVMIEPENDQNVVIQGANNSDEDSDMDDDDLYMSAAPQVVPQSDELIDESNVSNLGGLGTATESSTWCLTYHESGSLTIYSLPSFEEVFYFPRFDQLPSNLTDTSKKSSDTATPQLERSRYNEPNSGKVTSVILAAIGKELKLPYIVASTETNDIVVYKSYQYTPIYEASQKYSADLETDTLDVSSRLGIRFSRIDQDMIYSHQAAEKQQDDIVENGIDPEVSSEHKDESRLVPFANIGGYSGVFVTGKKPLWVLCSIKSPIRVHPMATKRVIKAFTPFHNINFQHGFLTADDQAHIQMRQLPVDNITYDTAWPMKKILLNYTVHKVQYHAKMEVYAMLVSSPQPIELKNDEGAPLNGKDTRDEGEYLPMIEEFSMVLVSPITWEVVDKHTLDEAEQGFALDCMNLESKQTASGRKDFMVIGTGYLKGEDTAMKGRILIFDVIEVVPEIDNPQTNHKFKLVHTEEVKGAVTALCACSGHLVSTTGPKVIIYSFEDNESLVGVAFIDVQTYVTSMVSIKNFILLGDAQKSIWFLGYQVEPAKLIMLGKDYHDLGVNCVSFLAEEKSLQLLVGDTEENVALYQYAPYNLQSYSGLKLMRRGDFHMGSQVHCAVRLPSRQRTPNGIEYGKRHFSICGSLNGSIAMVSPITEKTYKRLLLLYGQLVNGVQHVAGLNPRAFRIMRSSKEKLASNRSRAILDGDLIFQFINLPLNRQQEMTKQIGTTVERIMEDLIDIAIGVNNL
ncbi:mRNA cleavage and polyadenylation factor subunit [Umbelopsis sp. WA50703]